MSDLHNLLHRDRQRRQAAFGQMYENLAPGDRKALDECIERTRTQMLAKGFRADFFGGASLNLDSIFVDPRPPHLQTGLAP